MHLDTTARGVFPIAPTPFHPDGRVDESSIDRLAEFYARCGAAGVTVGVSALGRHGVATDEVGGVLGDEPDAADQLGAAQCGRVEAGDAHGAGIGSP